LLLLPGARLIVRLTLHPYMMRRYDRYIISSPHNLMIFTRYLLLNREFLKIDSEVSI
jgi:hypothetical protein